MRKVTSPTKVEYLSPFSMEVLDVGNLLYAFPSKNTEKKRPSLKALIKEVLCSLFANVNIRYFVSQNAERTGKVCCNC